MSLIVWLIVGAIAGWLGSLVMGKDQSMGVVANIVVGIVGALIGGFLVTLLSTGEADFTSAITGFNLTSIVVSTIGAIVLLAVLKAFNKAPR